MWITHRDAIVMYAKFCRAHYGSNAHQKVKKRAQELGGNGDFEGERVWNEVASEIEKVSQQRPLFL